MIWRYFVLFIFSDEHDSNIYVNNFFLTFVGVDMSGTNSQGSSNEDFCSSTSSWTRIGFWKMESSHHRLVIS